MRFWRVSFFEGFWLPKRHHKLLKSGNFGALGPDFVDFLRFFGTPFLKKFWSEFKSGKNPEKSGILGSVKPSQARPGTIFTDFEPARGVGGG